ncbi:UDP-N-acetylmuramoyl-L-alanyl-D-glutamate--2,6-diaminopimelate ligase [Erysipelotrichaceae bacterium OttesenSCG-928-M19]|nr:UDP-N-acetylmuramoyl-L-alanyl-D-glutamate--2,6-diaminopimelate ligase [Erysipelotrichaceae bacterium OttesenSCG-928-M19]
MKKLNELLELDSTQTVAYLSEDNRDIKENTLFFCLKGAHFDGHQVVADVIEKGAKVIVHTDDITNKHTDIIYYQSKDIASDMALISTRFYDDPSSKLNLIGITGTNGKTTIAWVLADILNRLTSCGYIGTIDIEYNNHIYKNLYTTPKPIELNYHLKEMVKEQVKYCALEISSHALTLKRTDFLKIKYAIMSNLTFEHVNFHGSMMEYGKAKRLLFENLSADNYAILNKDDSTYDDYATNTKAQIVSYGIENDADLMAKDILIKKDGTSFTLVYKNKEYNVVTNLIALFNVYNLLAVFAVLILEGYLIEDILKLVKNIKQPKGRMEVIAEGQDYDVIIDYAHTEDGFIKVFEYAQKMAKGDIIAVFGSAGGDRDKEKRPALGAIADKYSQKIILTEEDIRDETTQSIALDIAQGIKHNDYLIIDKREDALAYVIEHAKKDDMILILAKADDRYNIVNNEAIPYEGDIDLARRLIKERMNKDGVK